MRLRDLMYSHVHAYASMPSIEGSGGILPHLKFGLLLTASGGFSDLKG